MAKRLMALVVCFVMIIAIVGCAGGSSKSISKAQAEANKKLGTYDWKKADTASWKDMTLRVAGYRLFNDDPLNYEYASGAEEFTKKYGTKVNFLVGGGDGLNDDLVAGIMSGDPWEVQYAFGITVFPTTFTEELYTPITEYINYDYFGDMVDKGTVQGTYWKGNYYGVSNAGMQEYVYMAYNETWLKELGLETPHEYYAKGEWTLENLAKLLKETKAQGINSRLTWLRPHVVGMYMSSWNDETGEVTVTYDGKQSMEWLSYWGTLLSDPAYNIKGKGYVSTRNVAIRDEVCNVLVKDEATQQTNDVIRYIQPPREDANGKQIDGVYLTDSHFLVPLGVKKDKIPPSVLLSAYMCKAKQDMIYSDTYDKHMKKEDVELMNKALANCYYLPRWFYKSAWPKNAQKFVDDMKAGKAVATHVAENIENYKAKAKEFNEKYIY
ncbi:MAG: hypothetical protein Q8882_00595 [Bacillota bacterium]|nr:hypothetical protein [Bacillota bacterium]